MMLSRPWDLTFKHGVRELRYFYIAFPAITCITAYVLLQMMHWFKARVKIPWLSEGLLIGVLALNAWWTIPQTLDKVFENVILM